MTTQENIITLYKTLREMKKHDFDENDYFWRIGWELFKELQPFFTFQSMNEPLLLMGIKVEINRFNPNELKLFEDITNKVAIPYAEVKEIVT